MEKERRSTEPSTAALLAMRRSTWLTRSSSGMTPPWERRMPLASSLTSSRRVVRTVRLSLESAMLSIWRMRSRVTLKCFPIFSSVCFGWPNRANRFFTTITSFSVRTMNRLFSNSCKLMDSCWEPVAYWPGVVEVTVADM